MSKEYTDQNSKTLNDLMWDWLYLRFLVSNITIYQEVSSQNQRLPDSNISRTAEEYTGKKKISRLRCLQHS